jgi:hypothetical protein
MAGPDLDIKTFDPSKVITVWKQQIYETEVRRLVGHIRRYDKGEYKLQLISHRRDFPTQKLPWLSVFEWDAILRRIPPVLRKLRLVEDTPRGFFVPEPLECNKFLEVLFQAAALAVTKGPYGSYIFLADELNHMFDSTLMWPTQALCMVLDVMEA